MDYARIKASFPKAYKTLKKKKGLLGKLFLILGFLFILLIPLYKSGKNYQELQKVENVGEGQDFDHGPIQADPKLLEGEYQEELLPTQIIIPSVSIDIPIKKARVVKGKWEVFEDTGSFGLGSALPGKTGNQVIFAHARVGLFLPLKNIKTGMKIYVLTDEKWFSYQVKEIKEVLPSDISVIGPTDDETLTLYTCSGFSDSKRLIVTAKRT